MRKGLLGQIGALLLAMGLLVPLHADTFVLKDGSKHEGVAVKDGDTLVISTFDGRTVRVKESDVLGIKKDEDRNEYHARVKKLKPDDAAAHYELALWAQGRKDLENEARQAFMRVLKVDPFHEGAGKALGYVQKDGRWVLASDPAEAELTIGQTKPQTPAKPVDRADAGRKLAKELEPLNIPGGTDWEKSPEVRAMVERAAQSPESFAAALKAPGWPGGANVQDATIRAKAAVLLGLAGDRRAMQPLLDACFEDPDDRVRWAAAKALPKLDEPIAMRKLVDAAVSARANWPTRKLASIALRRYGDKQAVERLMGELSFELAGGNFRDPKNKPRAATTGPGTDNPMGLPTENLPTQAEDDTVIYPALSAMREVTGNPLPGLDKDMKFWREWWKKNEATFALKD